MGGGMRRSAHSLMVAFNGLVFALMSAPATHAATPNLTTGVDVISRGIHALQMLILTNTNTPSAIGHMAGALALISVAGVFANVVWGTTRALLVCMLCFAVNAMICILELGIDTLLVTATR